MLRLQKERKLKIMKNEELKVFEQKYTYEEVADPIK